MRIIGNSSHPGSHDLRSAIAELPRNGYLTPFLAGC
jgi:hypothetical protein